MASGARLTLQLQQDSHIVHAEEKQVLWERKLRRELQQEWVPEGFSFPACVDCWYLHPTFCVLTRILSFFCFFLKRRLSCTFKPTRIKLFALGATIYSDATGIFTAALRLMSLSWTQSSSHKYNFEMNNLYQIFVDLKLPLTRSNSCNLHPNRPLEKSN